MMWFGRFTVVLVCSVFVTAVSGFAAASVSSPTTPTSTKHPVAAQMLGMPLQFEANHGQVDEQVKFLARGKGYTLFLTPTESVMVLTGREASRVKSEAGSGPADVIGHESQEYKQSVVRMKLEGANTSPAIDGMEKLPGIVNYFIGNDPAKWRTKIPTYAKVQYREAYPGIDLAYYGNQGKLEYDFIVAPGADPDQIKLAFEGASDIRVADSGDLLLTTTLGEVRLQKPVVYQLEPNGHKTLVAGQYLVHEDHSSFLESRAVQIQLAAYDHTKSLVIDPVLLFSTYLGGNGGDSGKGIAIDANRNMYVTGITMSTDFPTLNAAQGSRGGGPQDIMDVFVTKLSATGSLIYSTYLGGSGAEGGGYDYFFQTSTFASPSIAVDTAGNAYVVGSTQSTNFPTLNAYQASNGGPSALQISDDAFVTKLSPTGGLVYSTYLGSPSTDLGFDVAVDAAQNAYVTGQTGSQDFPIYNTNAFLINLGLDPRFSDAFVAKFNATGGLVYSRFFGGGISEFAPFIAADETGNVYLTGETYSNLLIASTGANQETYGGNGDAFVAKLDTAGTTLWCTYLGGGGRDLGKGIAVDGSGNVYVTGETLSTNFPILNATQPIEGGDFSIGYSDAFVAKYNSTGARLYATYLGGSNFDTGIDIAADAAGNAYVTGQTASGDFPLLTASQPTYGGSFGDAFVTKLNAAGARVYSTYLGGDGLDKGYGIAVDTAGNAYVTGEGASSNFPLVNPNLPSPPVVNAFVAKLGEPNTNQPPVCSAAQASPASIWTPDGTFVPIVVTGVTDPDGDSVTITVTTVTQDEPVKGKGDKTSPDAVIQAGSSSVRAERLNSGNGRVYQISFRADDGNGSSCTGAVKVGVPLSLKKGLAAIDDGQLYNSTIP